MGGRRFLWAAVLVGLAEMGFGGAAGFAAPAAGAAAADEAFQKGVAELKSGDAGREAKEVAAVRADVDGGKQGTVGMRVLGVMVGMDKEMPDVDSICEEAIVMHPESPLADFLLQDRITALLHEGKKDAALALAKSYYDAATLSSTAQAIQRVAECLVLDTPAEKGLAARFKRQQIVWATAADTRPATLAEAGGTGGAATREAGGDPAAAPRRGAGAGEGNGGGDLGEPVLAGIKVDVSPYEAAIEAIDPLAYADFVRKGDLLLLADRAAEAKEMFKRAAELAENDSQRLESATNIARAIRAESGCVGPANAYILSLKDQK